VACGDLCLTPLVDEAADSDDRSCALGAIHFNFARRGSFTGSNGSWT
jgi:hypothetical protein